MRIYVASSWRNPWQPNVVGLLRSLGHEVYDFREPIPGDNGFHWREVDPKWRGWTPKEYREGLKHPLAKKGFKSDADALAWCDACVAVQPYGTSTALELGWASGAGKRTAILFPIGMPLSPIGGHTIDTKVPCEPCTQTRHEPSNCKLPSKLDAIEPELMALLADAILIGRRELTEWATDDWPKGSP
jgi:hypothetical protein